MTKLSWDNVGERYYETGVDHGVLYLPNNTGQYNRGFPWNGVTAITEKPSGADANPMYADNIKYLNLVAAEQFGATIEAYTYPDEFGQCDGTAEPTAGIAIGQQSRKTFGMSYRTLKGNDVDGTDLGYKLHLIYGALAAPTEKAHSTVNDKPEAIAFSWDVSTTPVNVPGYKPTSTLSIDSTKVDAAKLAELEDLLYGTAGVDPKLPTPAEVIDMFGGTVVEVQPAVPTYDNATHTVTIPAIAGVVYQVDGVTVTGSIVITGDTVVTAIPAEGYKFPAVTDDDWYFDFV